MTEQTEMTKIGILEKTIMMQRWKPNRRSKTLFFPILYRGKVTVPAC